MSSTDYISSIFTFGRVPPFPAIYPELKTAVTVDVLEVGWIVAFATAYVSFLLLLPAAVGKEKALYFTRITLLTFIGLIVMLCNFGQEWEVGSIESAMFYKAGASDEIHGHVGVKLGLRSVNITLQADPHDLPEGLRGEIINYNERFTWTWAQGRRGFGPFAGRVQQEFREAQLRGAPYPILWVAEYFTFDGEGLRFGRHYRHAGWYAHICVWCAFVCWMLMMILFKIYLRYGAIMLSALGLFLVIAALIWCSVRNFIELAIVFNNNDVSGVLRTTFGVHWWLALIVGIFCILAGILIGVLDIFFHNDLCKFFGLDPYAIIDELYEEDYSEKDPQSPGGIEMTQMTQPTTGKKRKTVMYKPRGTKKLWKNSAMDYVPDNNRYFESTDRPLMDPEYLHVGYYDDNQYPGPENYHHDPNVQQQNLYHPEQNPSNFQQYYPGQGEMHDQQNFSGHIENYTDGNIVGQYPAYQAYNGQQVDPNYQPDQQFQYQMDQQGQFGQEVPEMSFAGGDGPPLPPKRL